MSRPTLSSQISLGNVIQIVALLMAVAGSWFIMDSRSNENAKRLVEVRGYLAQIENRVRELETNAARADERFSNILALLARIDTRLERIERNAE